MTDGTNDKLRAVLTHDDALDDVKRARIWANLDARLDTPVVARRWRWPVAFAIAASAAAVLGIVMRHGSDGDVRTLVAPAEATLDAPLGPHTHARLVGPAALDVVGPAGDATTVRLATGTLYAQFDGGAGRSLRIVTAAATIEIVGTVFAVEVRDDDTCVSVAHGRVRATSSRGEWFVSTGEHRCARDAASSPIEPRVKDALARHEAVIAATGIAPDAVVTSNDMTASISPPSSNGAAPPEPPTSNAATASSTSPTTSIAPPTSNAATASSASHTTTSIAPPPSTTTPSPSSNTAASNTASSSTQAANGAALPPSNHATTSIAPSSNHASITPPPSSNHATSTSPPPSSNTTTSSATTSSAHADSGTTSGGVTVPASRAGGSTIAPPPTPIEPPPPPAPPTAADLYRTAEAALARHDLVAADRALAKLVTDMPASPLVDQALYDRARIAFSRRAWGDARRHLDALAALGASSLTEPGRYLACRVAVSAHDSSARRCLTDYRASFPKSPHDADARAMLSRLPQDPP